MNLIPKPKQDMFSDLQREIDSIFSRFSPGLWSEEFGPFAGEPFSSFSPVVDVDESGDAVHVRAELPGLEKDQISIDVTGQTLTLSGEKKQEEEKKDEGYYSRERSFGKFSRQITLPAEVDTDKTTAEYKNGVLHINMPKTESAVRKKIEVKVN